MKRSLLIVVTTAMLVLSMASVAVAGSIPVVTFGEVPTEFQAGTPYTLDYSILAHGKEPMDLGATAIRFQGPDGESLTFSGVSLEKGRWTAEVTLPEAGEWRWEVVSGTTVLQTLGSLSVTPASAPPSSDLLTSLRIWLPIATVLAVFLLVSQLVSKARLEPSSHPATDVV